jgi:hypothetical protein
MSNVFQSIAETLSKPVLVWEFWLRTQIWVQNDDWSGDLVLYILWAKAVKGLTEDDRHRGFPWKEVLVCISCSFIHVNKWVWANMLPQWEL